MANDRYLTIDKPGFGELKEKGSKFLSFAHAVKNESELEQWLLNLKDTYPKASHYCYAIKWGSDGEKFRINDDGEPSGTAGRPILGQISSLGLTNTAVVVIRYFGGTKLGVSGLIQAYKEAARLALLNASVKEIFLTDTFNLEFGYADMGHIMSVIKDLPVDIYQKSFEDACLIQFGVKRNISLETIRRLKADVLRVSIEEISDKTELPECVLTKLENTE